MRSTIAVVCATLTLAAALPAAQERYVRAEENENHDLVITTSVGERIVVAKADRKWADEEQVGFRDIAISRDGAAVGWVAYYPNCCTSYPIPILVEAYRAGKRHTFDLAIAPWHWCFVDGSAKIAAISTTVHGPQHEVIGQWDASTGTKRGDFIWGEGESCDALTRAADASPEALRLFGDVADYDARADEPAAPLVMPVISRIR